MVQMHRIREAMRTKGLEPMGGNGGIVVADETISVRLTKPLSPPSAKAVLSLSEVQQNNLSAEVSCQHPSTRR